MSGQRTKIRSEAGKAKVGRVLKEFKAGKLKSSSGEKVTDRAQAIAISLSEGREKEKKRVSSRSRLRQATLNQKRKKPA